MSAARFIRLRAWLQTGAVDVSRRCVARWFRRQQPPADVARKIGGRWFVDPDALNTWLFERGYRVKDTDIQRRLDRVKAVYAAYATRR